MTRVDFYVLSSQSEQEYTEFACRLTEKAYKLGHKVYVYTNEVDGVRVLDDKLWTFRDRAFVPHKRAELDGWDDAVPVHVGDVAPLGHADVLINLSSSVPPFFAKFERIAELIDNRDAIKLQGRERFKRYKEQGCNVTTHQVSG